MSEQAKPDERERPEFNPEETAAIQLLRMRFDASEGSEDRRLLLEALLDQFGIADDEITRPTDALVKTNTAEEKEKVALKYLADLFPSAGSEEHRTMHRAARDPDDELTDRFMNSLRQLLTGQGILPRDQERLEKSIERLRLTMMGHTYAEIAKISNVTHRAIYQNMGRLARTLNHDRKPVYELLNTVYGFGIDTSDMHEPLELQPTSFGRGAARRRKIGKQPVADVVVFHPKEESAPAIPSPHFSMQSESQGDRWQELAHATTMAFEKLFEFDEESAAALGAFLDPHATDSIPEERQQAAAVRLRNHIGQLGLSPEFYKFNIEEAHVTRKLLGLPSPRAEQQEYSAPRPVAALVREYMGDTTNPRNRSMPGFIEASVYGALSKILTKHRTISQRGTT